MSDHPTTEPGNTDGPRPSEPDDGSAAGPAGTEEASAGDAPAGGDDGGGTRFVFIDTEATGLDHSRHELTEVSWIVRFEDGTEAERQYFPDHTLDGADEDALELTSYEERIAPRAKTPASEWLTQFLEDAEEATIVGAVPDFDVHHLRRMCRKLEVEPTWDHHLVDVETLALPLIAAAPETPRGLASTCAALGVDHDEDRAHGALYDARQAKRVFDAVWGRYHEIRETAGTLPAAVPRDQDDDGGPDGHEPARGDEQADRRGPGGPADPATAGGGADGTDDRDATDREGATTGVRHGPSEPRPGQSSGEVASTS